MTIGTDPGLSFDIIRPDPPRSPEAAEFFRTHPEFEVSSSVAFLADRYPDTSSWIVDSGIAVQALTGRRLTQPSDLDIVCRDPGMEIDFGHSNGLDPSDRRYIDVKFLDHWLLGRGEVPSDPTSLWQYISGLSVPIDIGGHVVRVMHPALIAATKSTMTRMAQRPKDLADVELLAVSPAHLAAATELLRGHEPDKQFEFLKSADHLATYNQPDAPN